MDEEAGGEEEAVRVFVRIRPLNKREIAEKQTIGWNFNETAMLEDTPNGQRVYAYDHCFGPDSSNQFTYDIVGKPVVLKAMEGYNGTVFTYGQTGSGKTWTMRGCESDPGMMVLCIRDILEWVTKHPEHKYVLKVAYLEVYNEEINDLLGEQGPSSKNLKIISEDAAKGAVIGGLVEEVAKTAEDFMAILQRGEASRSYASTNMNAESSRSHTIYRVSIDVRDESSSDDTPPMRTSYLNLVDLAGSERQKSTKAEGKVLKEGANINKSLLALGAVINKLGEASKKAKGPKPFIPYRDSKLTRILKQSLGGNTMTSILCAVTPAPMHREETVSTLKFGQTCKSIKNNVKTNDGVLDDKALIKQYRQTIEDMKKQIEDLQSGDFAQGGGGGSKLDAEARAEYEGKIAAMEALLVSKGASAAEIAAVVPVVVSHSSGAGGISAESSAHYEHEIAKLTDKLAEQQRLVVKLERQLSEYGDLEESKNSFEEYEHNVRQEIDEEQQKLEDEKLTLQNERFKLLKDRSAIDEKESRIGLLITNLDEKESKLRQMMANMKEQQQQWDRSVTDLQRREDLVDDWQRNHKQREKKLQEIENLQTAKYQELKEREWKIIDDENKIKQQQKELIEREQRLQVGLSRIANGELTNQQKEESLKEFENLLKKKEHECDLRDRELTSRRKELESWDALLREKDRKISNEQKQLDDRETSIRQQEDDVKKHERENEKKTIELKSLEIHLEEMKVEYEQKIQQNNTREKELKDRDTELKNTSNQQSIREDELRTKETKLNILQEQMKDIQLREATLHRHEELFKQKENEFYNVKVAQITSRHKQELKKLEETVTRQLKIASDFQLELEQTRNDVVSKTSMIQELQHLMESKDQSIEQLREQIHKLESGHLSNIAGQVASLQLNELGEVVDSSGNVVNTSSNAANTNTDAANGPNTGNGPHGRNGSISQANTNTNAGVLSAFSPMGRGPGFHNSGMPSRGGGGMNAALSNSNPSDVMAQLIITRHLIHQVLEKHDALPDTKALQNQRKGYVVKSPVPPGGANSAKGVPPPPNSPHPHAQGMQGMPGQPPFYPMDPQQAAQYQLYLQQQAQAQYYANMTAGQQGAVSGGGSAVLPPYEESKDAYAANMAMHQAMLHQQQQVYGSSPSAGMGIDGIGNPSPPPPPPPGQNAFGNRHHDSALQAIFDTEPVDNYLAQQQQNAAAGNRQRKNAINPQSNPNTVGNSAVGSAEKEKKEFGAASAANVGTNPSGTSAAASATGVRPGTSRGVSSTLTKQRPQALNSGLSSPVASNLSQVLSPKPAVPFNRLASPATLDISSAIRTTKDKTGNVVTSIDFGLNSDLRKISKALNTGATTAQSPVRSPMAGASTGSGLGTRRKF